MNGPLPVVYLAGSGHTGSTLLALLMDSHPAIASVGEVAVKPQIRRRGDAARQPCSCGATIADCRFWQQLFAHVQAQGFRFGVDAWTNDYQCEHPWLHAVFTRESSYRLLQGLQGWSAHHLPIFSSWVERTGRVNVAFIRAVLELSGAAVFLDTSKRAIRLQRLLELPDVHVKVITLVRDVRGYAASAKQRGISVDDAASSWRKDQELLASVTRALPEGSRMLLRYEELCEAPSETLRRLYRFCGVTEIEPVTSTRSSEHHVLGNRLRRQGPIEVRLDESWRERLAPQEQRQILRIAGTLHERFGYAWR